MAADRLPPGRLDPDSPSSVPWPALFAGDLDVDPRGVSGRRGRTRRWSYTAAGDEHLMVGAAVVDIGVAATGFAWALVGDDLHTWEARGLPRRNLRMGRTAREPARFQRRDARLSIGPDGDLDLDVPVAAGRLHARTRVTAQQPAVLLATTPGGGWNATQKSAGEPAEVEVSVGGRRHTASGGSWRDWTLGAQDRHTIWRWAAGAGSAADGRRVGLNLSTGMNEVGPGENLVWWDGVPHAVPLSTLAPAGDDPRGRWTVGGEGWSLDFTTRAVRAADEGVPGIRSRYVQPVGTFRGTLPGPDGVAVEVTLHGVTEDHEATW